MTEQTISEEIPQINLSDPKQLADFARYVVNFYDDFIYVIVLILRFKVMELFLDLAISQK